MKFLRRLKTASMRKRLFLSRLWAKNKFWNMAPGFVLLRSIKRGICVSDDQHIVHSICRHFRKVDVNTVKEEQLRYERIFRLPFAADCDTIFSAVSEMDFCRGEYSGFRADVNSGATKKWGFRNEK